MDNELRINLLNALNRDDWNRFFRLVYDAYNRRIFAIAVGRQNQLGRGAILPEDVVQEVFTTLFSKYDCKRFAADRLEKIPNLLIKITFNLTFDINRKEKNKHQCCSLHETPEISGEKTVDDFQSEFEFSDFMKHLLATLNCLQRKIFTMRLGGYTHREIAGHLEVSEHNSRQIYRQSRLRLCELIDRQTVPA